MRGQTVYLYEKTQTGTDPFGQPIYTEQATPVDNVLIGEPSTEDVATSQDMYGKKIAYMLGIPKGDSHNWQDSRIDWVDAYGITHRVQSFGFPITGIEANIPGPWHMKVRVEQYG